MAGQSVGFVKAIEPVERIIVDLVAQTEAALMRTRSAAFAALSPRAAPA